MLAIRNHVCRTVLLEFRVIHLCRTHCCPFQNLPAVQFYSSTGWFVSAEVTLKPLLYPRNYHPLTHLLEFRVVHLCRMNFSHCWPFRIMPARQLYCSSCSSFLLNPLQPLRYLNHLNHPCRTVLLEFRVVRLCRTHSNCFSTRKIINPWHFYRMIRLCQTHLNLFCTQGIITPDTFTRIQDGSSLPNPLEPLLQDSFTTHSNLGWPWLQVEYWVVCPYSNPFCIRAIITLWVFYSRSWCRNHLIH